MSERVSVEELVGEAEKLVWELLADDGSNPHVVVRGWARFRTGAEHYLLASAGPAWYAGTGRWKPPPATGPLAGTGDRRLERAGDLLGAAGDLIETHRDRRGRGWSVASDQDAQTASRNRAAEVLSAGAHAVVQAYAQARQESGGHDPGGRNIGAAAAAVEVAAIRAATDGSRAGPIDELEIAGPPADDPAGQFLAAIRDWQRQALATADDPAPSSHELAVHAMAGDFLMAVTSRLQATAGQDHRLADEARGAWQEVGRQWSGRTSAQPARAETAAAAGQLQRAALDLAAAEPPEPRRLAAILREASERLADVAGRHTGVAGVLSLSGRLYAPARRVDPRPASQPEQQWLARAAARDRGRWVPLMPAETQSLIDAYTRATAATAAARSAFTSRRISAVAGEAYPSRLEPSRPAGPTRSDTTAGRPAEPPHRGHMTRGGR